MTVFIEIHSMLRPVVVYRRPKYLAEAKVFYYLAFGFGFVLKMGHYPFFFNLKAGRLIHF